MDKTQFNPRPFKELCPFDLLEWERLKGIWNCSDQELYHCLPNQYNYPGQICVKPNWVLKNYCPIYNTVAAKIDLIPCDSQYGACSDKDYRSNLVYMYSGCLNKTEILEEIITDTPPKQLLPFPLHFLVIAAVVALVVLILVGLASWFFCRRRKARKYAPVYQLEPMIGQDEIPIGFQKAFKYLKYVFTPNHLYEHAIGTLELHHCLTIIGPPGSGKTITALQLAYRKCAVSGRSRVYFCRSVHELESTAAGKEDAYIIVDDWLDRYMYYPSTLLPAIASLTKFYDEFIQSGKVHLILTAQKDKWAIFRDTLTGCALFEQKCLLIIDSSELNEEERYNIILRHFKHFNVEEGDEKKAKKYADKKIVGKGTKKRLAKEIEDENEFSFPVMIDLIYINERWRGTTAQNLIFKDRFSKILKQFLNNWLKDEDTIERKCFCVLVFAALLGGKVSPSDFQSPITGPLFERVCKEFKLITNANKVNIEIEMSNKENEMSESEKKKLVQSQPSLVENANWGKLLDENERLKGCLYKISDTKFIFHHPSLHRFVLSFIKDRGDIFFIENANIEVLLNQCWLEDEIMKKYEAETKEITLKAPVGSVILRTTSLKALAERVGAEKSVGYNIPEWNNHIFMNQTTFQKMWGKVQSEL